MTTDIPSSGAISSSDILLRKSLQATVEDARTAAADAIAFALEGEEHANHGGRVEYLDVAVG